MEEITLEELTFEKDDLLNRKQIAINLTNIMKNKSNLNVLAIDSSWGTGKTTFINKWTNMLKSDSNYIDTFETIYFNAWESDYSNDALLSLIFQINKSISKTLEDDKSLFEKHNEKFKNIGKLAGTLAIKYLTRGALDLVEWNKNLENGLSDFSSKIGESIFKQHSIQNDTRKALKKNLIEYQNIIDKKIIIFIDELDRCKPTYSIQILETIKHLFNLKNYIFVISLDKEQLSHSIKTIYGEHMDSDGYLRRFFDLEYTLSTSATRDYIDIKLNSLLKNFSNKKMLLPILIEIFEEENYSLRDIEKALPFIELLLLNSEIFNSKKTNYTHYQRLTISYIYAFLINLKLKHSNLLKELLACNYNDTSINKFFTFDIKVLKLNSLGLKQEQLKSLLELSIKKFLQIYRLYNKHKFIENNYTNNFFVGIQNEKTGTLKSDTKVSILEIYKYEKPLEKLLFTENFNI
ncbi:KAP family P-loop NTPase fold protein [Clostridium perfringens]|uniref:KAP family P-loop NTPase fold protein n=1 Tax=Clostridium perfringens TaxID=1502 RepID=UPI0024BC5B15|nr:P-loop NTPase fold protein [Clostridium perfringens]